eukprot:15274137-Ditylum_brightwellii.AAC.1
MEDTRNASGINYLAPTNDQGITLGKDKLHSIVVDELEYNSHTSLHIWHNEKLCKFSTDYHPSEQETLNVMFQSQLTN